VRSAEQLYAEVFATSGLTVEANSNVLAATAFLYALAAEELHREELDYNDSDYQALITVLAVKK